MNTYKRVKKDTKWTIQELGSFKIDSIKKEVINFKEEWLEDVSRQSIGTTHKNTEMYRLFSTDYEWIPGTELITEYKNTLKHIESRKELFDMFNVLEYYYSGKIIRCEFVKLKANSEVYKHTDGGPLLHYSRRIHVPLVTNDLTTFTVMNNEMHMKEGGWYEINNQLPHSVKNFGNCDRIHMIIDVMPYDMINYKG